MRTVDDGKPCQKLHTRLQKCPHFDTPKGFTLLSIPGYLTLVNSI